jgi:CRP/FNR family cyclic AMP-dependent transcriptional regulator
VLWPRRCAKSRMSRVSSSSAEATRARKCTLSWKAASGFPYYQLRAECFRLVTRSAAIFFGEIATLDGQDRTADAMALTRVTTAMLSRSSLRRLMEAKPQLAQAMVALLCRRLRTTSDQVEAIALHSTKVRLARFLLAATALKGEGDANQRPAVLDIEMSQTELGLLLGASRTKINEALAALEKLGGVHHTARHIECHVDALRAVAKGNEPHASQS